MRWRIWMLGLAALVAASSSLQAALIVGDVAIIGVNSDNPDEFAWVPFRHLDPGERIFFTDAGWINARLGGASPVASDGILRFTTPPGGIEIGAVQVARLGSLGSAYEAVSHPNLGNMSMSPLGDQLAAFSGTLPDPVFLFAVNLAASIWTTTAGSSSDGIRSGLYPGLTADLSAVAVGTGPRSGDEVDNARFEGITQGTASELLEAVADPRNWVGLNATGGADRFADLTNGTSRFVVVTETATVPEPGSFLTWMIGVGSVAWILRWRSRGRYL